MPPSLVEIAERISQENRQKSSGSVSDVALERVIYVHNSAPPFLFPVTSLATGVETKLQDTTLNRVVMFEARRDS
ncbi:hypothetical protein GCM10007857_66860 [Bradyrhizobium iriomotense]|uniref:Uncharacterized protein n=1 Tax=Bradyrhizobium iriomotense TaxID=441950 RepID=A0ABQ6BCW2_9BRAD|nr:hypothetical protein GCM10007857_66860 [Bradyrhizobium iriomotense]